MSTSADRFVAARIRRTECLQLKQWIYGNATKFNIKTKRAEEVKLRSSLLYTSDADPDPDFHSDADPDPHADPTPCFTHVRKSDCIENFHSLQ